MASVASDSDAKAPARQPSRRLTSSEFNESHAFVTCRTAAQDAFSMENSRGGLTSAGHLNVAAIKPGIFLPNGSIYSIYSDLSACIDLSAARVGGLGMPELKQEEQMSESPLLAPQLIRGARMIYLVWTPEDASAVAALVPKELRPEARRSVFMNQYIVDSAEHTSNSGLPGSFGSYSLTYLGVDLEGLDAQPNTPGRWWTHYFNSSANMIAYAKKHGVPASAGQTTLQMNGDRLVATTLQGGAPIIRTSCTTKVGVGQPASGQLRYITRVDDQLISGRYAFVMKAADQFRVDEIQFLDRLNPIYALRPKSPLEVTFGFYSPDITFCYPGGEGPLNTPPHGI